MSDRPTAEDFAHKLELRLADLNVLATRTFQLAEIAGVERLRCMKASYALAAARNLRDTADLLEKAAGNE